MEMVYYARPGSKTCYRGKVIPLGKGYIKMTGKKPQLESVAQSDGTWSTVEGASDKRSTKVVKHVGSRVTE